MFERLLNRVPEAKASSPRTGPPNGPSAMPLDRLISASAGGASPFASNVVAYRCIRMIAEGAASVPLHARDDGAPRGGALCDLLARPNADRTGPAFFEEVYGHLQVHGDAYVEAVRSNGRVTALYTLRPDRVRVEAGPDGWPDAYVYQVGSVRRRIARAPDGFMPVLHLRLFDPASDTGGQSPLQAARVAVRTHDAACAWNEQLLANAARPSGAVVHKGQDGMGLTGEQFDRLKAELEQSFQGGQNAGRPMVLDGGLDWMPLGLSPAEMDFVALKNSSARDIALAFGIPPQLLGIPGDNTYATYREANLAFWRQTVLPLVSKMAGALSAWVCTATESVSYDPAGVDALSSERSERLSRIVEADFLTDAEKRIALGYAPEPQGRLS